MSDRARLGLCLVLLVCLIGPAGAWADGPYLGVSGGTARSPDAAFRLSGPFAIRGDTDFETGYQVGANVGYAFGPWRVEGDVRYRESGITKINFGAAGFSAAGDLKVLTGFFNGYYEHEFESFPVRPFIGGGVGAAQIGYDLEARPRVVVVDDDVLSFAYNIAGGITLPVSDYLSLLLRYRYVRTPDVELDEDALGPTFDFETRFESHEVEMGLRFEF